MSHYVGVLEGDQDVWSVWIPDLLGCVGAGATPDDAVKDATSALSTVATMMIVDGEELPPPRTRTELMHDARVAEAVRNGDVLVALPLLIERGRSTRANISLDVGLLESIDAAAKARGLTRSAFLASAAREKILSEA